MYESLLRFPSDIFSEFARLQREMEQAFGGLGVPTSIRAAGHGAFPAIDLGSSPSSFEIYAFAPGIDPAKIDVTVDRGLLTIAGERPSALPEPNEKVNVYASERYTGPFKRVINLPDNLDASAIEARYRDGVLRVSIPVRQEAQRKHVEIK
jgi:HSP20 family protein